MAEVSLEALSQAQKAFLTFRESLDEFAVLTKKRHSEITLECEDTLKKVKYQVKSTEESIAMKNLDMKKQEEKQEKLQKELKHQQELSQEGHGKLQQLQKSKKDDQYSLSTLESGVKTTRKDGTTYLKMDYEGMNLLKHQIKSCEKQIQEKENFLHQLKQNLQGLEEKRYLLKKEQEQMQLQLEQETQGLYQLEEQHQRLEHSYKKIQEDLRSYLSATISFNQQALEQQETRNDSLTRCIRAIEQYLATSLEADALAQ